MRSPRRSWTRQRAPRRPWWQSVAIAGVGFAVPFALVTWAGSTVNAVEGIRWQENWQELEGVAAGPVVEDADSPFMHVRVPMPGGDSEELRLPVAQMRPDPDVWRTIRAADEGDVVPLVRSVHQPGTIVVSPHFAPPPLGPWLLAAALIGAVNGLLLALAYRRRHSL